MDRLQSCRSTLTRWEGSAFGRLFRKLEHRRAIAGAAAAMALAAAALIAFELLRQRSTTARSDTTASPSTAAISARTSIAVLPLENLTADNENAYFADGIQDDILTSLAKISELKVISRTSASQHRGASAARNLREVARELGVDNILEGSVRRAGNRVILSVQLIDARNDRHLWAERYDRTAADAIGLQGELATQIAAALKARLAPEEKARLEKKATESPEACALYLRALGRERAVNQSSEDLIAAEQLYAEAIAFDAKFALAHARRSIVKSYLANGPSDNIALRTKARAEAEEALQLSPLLGEAHMAFGLCLYWAEKDYVAALREFSVAAAISPNEPNILHYIAGILRRQGRWQESLARDQRAQELDPRNVSVITSAALNHLLVRDWPGAAACYNRALAIAPDGGPRQNRPGLPRSLSKTAIPRRPERFCKTFPPALIPMGSVTVARWDLAVLARDFAAAERF